MRCPYCGKKTKEVSREENEQNDDMNIQIVYQCTNPDCRKEAVLHLEKAGWTDSDDTPIEEQG